MRLRISHLTSYRYQAPVKSVIQILRLTPRNHDSQYVARWGIDISADCRLDQHEDAFGNIAHTFTADGPLAELSVRAEGEVETRDSQGILRSTVERFPASLYLRETPCRVRGGLP
jgi:transglutaminase-like putative cysteine protease